MKHTSPHFPPLKHWRTALRALVGLTIVGVSVYALLSGLAPDQLTGPLQSTGNWSAILFVFLGTVLISVFVPKTAVSVSAGALFGTTIGIVLMTIVAILAALLNYVIGRWLLQETMERRLKKQSKYSGGTKMVVELAAEAGYVTHTLIRLSPIPTMVIGYGMGALRAKLRPYLVGAFAAMIAQSMWIHVGATAIQRDVTSLQWSYTLTTIAIALAVSVLLAGRAYIRLQQIHARDIV